MEIRWYQDNQIFERQISARALRLLVLQYFQTANCTFSVDLCHAHRVLSQKSRPDHERHHHPPRVASQVKTKSSSVEGGHI